MINLGISTFFFGQTIEQITIFSTKTAACTNLFTAAALIPMKTSRLNIYITVRIIRLLLKMGFKIIMFALWKLGPNLLPGPDMKHRQKWKFCVADQVRSNLRQFGVVWGRLPRVLMKDKPSQRWRKKPTWNTQSSAGGPNWTGGRTRCPGSVTYLLYDSMDSIA